MITVYVIVFFLVVIAIDFRIVLQSKDKKEATVYTLCLTLGIVILILKSLYVELPDPNVWIINGLKALSIY